MTRREEIIARGLEEQERAGTERIEALQERGQIIPASRISVADILKCMGIDPSRHPKGPLFWGRAEHAEHLRRWQEQIDDEMIVGRLHVALSNGDIERHPNTLRAWNEAVGFKISETE